ncbi:MAG: DUF3105 domain-containing protein [Acidimicrobiales bacterium]
MRRILLLVAVCVASFACSGGRTRIYLPAGGCGAPQHDAFDPHSVVHVLPGTPTPHYLTNPPTSGEHQPTNVPSYRGVRSTPILPQVQVALLESSQVLVQYRPPESPGPLLGLATNRLVTLAPDPSLPVPVVASAWTWRLPCAGTAPAAMRAIEAFVTAHAGTGPQAPPP